MYISSPLEPCSEDKDGMFGVNEVTTDVPVLDALKCVMACVCACVCVCE